MRRRGGHRYRRRGCSGQFCCRSSILYSTQRTDVDGADEDNLLFRWLVGLELDEPVWNHAVFSKNRDRLLNQDVAREFFSRVLAQAKPHLSDAHFSVHDTLIEAWASQKSFQKKDGGDDKPGQFRGERRSNGMNPRRIPKLGCTAKGTARRPNSAIWATC
jgi:hypothetical protein